MFRWDGVGGPMGLGPAGFLPWASVSSSVKQESSALLRKALLGIKWKKRPVGQTLAHRNPYKRQLLLLLLLLLQSGCYWNPNVLFVFLNPPTCTGPKKCTNRSLQYRKKK